MINCNICQLNLIDSKAGDTKTYQSLHMNSSFCSCRPAHISPTNDYEDTFRQIKPKSKLVLHFDVNETILIGDDAGGDTVHDCLNKIIAKCAYVKVDNVPELTTKLTLKVTQDLEPTLWCNGQPIGSEQHERCSQLTSPLYIGWEWPKNCCPYYRTAFKRRSKSFVESDDGKVFSPIFEQLKSSMLQYSRDHGLPESHPFYKMVPSFFYTIVKLKELKIDYSIVIRTFGTDLNDVALAIEDFANGKHPLFPNFEDDKFRLNKESMFIGRYRRGLGEGESIYDLSQWDEKHKIVASGDDEVLEVIENAFVCGIQDDYEYWDEHSNSPSCGKPVWIHPPNSEREYHHLFFDDNIHNDPTDGIVAVRTRKSDGHTWVSLTGEEALNEHGRYMFRVPTIAVLLQNTWFLNSIAKAVQSQEQSLSPI